MKKINNRWLDENNNSWSCTLETEESARLKSNTLINCSGCLDCSDCSDCLRCSGCSDCLYCSYCKGCKGYKSNPQRYVTPKIGSRNSQTSFYWTNENDVQVICGCYKGNLLNFENRVKDVHKNTEHLQAYLDEIRNVKYLINLT